jgi:hypothetical protein
MRKNFLRVLICARSIAGLVVILICGLGMTILTSCSNEDDPVPTPVVTETLMGDWLYVSESSFDDDGFVGGSESYALLNINENGVMIQKTYTGNAGVPLMYWERYRRHGMYSIDEAAHTLTFENMGKKPITVSYTLTDSQLILKYVGVEDYSIPAMTFRRPEATDLEFLERIDKVVRSDDYVGKWFGYTDWDDIGIRIYMMLDLTDDGIMNVRRYSVDKYNDCLRTVYSQYYEEYDNEDNMQLLMMHNSKDFNETYLYKWSVIDNTLTLGDLEDEEFNTVYHPLTPDDVALIEELDKLVKDNR